MCLELKFAQFGHNKYICFYLVVTMSFGFDEILSHASEKVNTKESKEEGVELKLFEFEPLLVTCSCSGLGLCDFGSCEITVFLQKSIECWSFCCFSHTHTHTHTNTHLHTPT